MSEEQEFKKKAIDTIVDFLIERLGEWKLWKKNAEDMMVYEHDLFRIVLHGTRIEFTPAHQECHTFNPANHTALYKAIEKFNNAVEDDYKLQKYRAALSTIEKFNTF